MSWRMCPTAPRPFRLIVDQAVGCRRNANFSPPVHVHSPDPNQHNSFAMRNRAPQPTPIRPVEPLQVACASCNLRELCLPVGLNERPGPARRPGRRRRTVPRGEQLFRSGDNFRRCTPVRTGFSRPAVTAKTGATRSPASRWRANCWAGRHQHRPPPLRPRGAGGLLRLRDPLRRLDLLSQHFTTCSTSSTRS